MSVPSSAACSFSRAGAMKSVWKAPATASRTVMLRVARQRRAGCFHETSQRRGEKEEGVETSGSATHATLLLPRPTVTACRVHPPGLEALGQLLKGLAAGDAARNCGRERGRVARDGSPLGACLGLMTPLSCPAAGTTFTPMAGRKSKPSRGALPLLSRRRREGTCVVSVAQEVGNLHALTSGHLLAGRLAQLSDLGGREGGREGRAGNSVAQGQ